MKREEIRMPYDLHVDICTEAFSGGKIPLSPVSLRNQMLRYTVANSYDPPAYSFSLNYGANLSV